MAKKFPAIGLALGSGGAKGLAHIGVLRSLEKHHIPVDLIAGSSIGSIIGAHYARFQSSKKLEEIILAFNRKKGLQLFDLTITGGLVKGVKTEEFISEILKRAQFTDLKIPFATVATDMNTANPIVFTSGDLVKAIRASTSVPAFYQPIIYENTIIADGGLSDPVPVDIAKEMGADIVIAVNLDTVYTEKPLTAIPSLAKIPMHSVNILQHNLALHSMKTADIIISPQNSFHIGILGWDFIFNNAKALKIMKAGEQATDEMIPEIKKKIALFIRNQSKVRKLISFFARKRS